MFYCFIHNTKAVAREMLEEHHKHPRAYGGADTPDNLVLLCPSCHSLVHQAAVKLYHGKGGIARDLVQQYIDNIICRNKLWDLVLTVSKARREHVRSIDIPEAEDACILEDTISVSLDMPSWMHHRLKTFSQGTGLAKYILNVLSKHCIIKSTMPGASIEILSGVESPHSTIPPIRLLK